MPSFAHSKKKGDIGEKIFREKFESTGCKVIMAKKGNFPGWDMVIMAPFGTFALEAKYDEASAGTGNVCVEFECLCKSEAAIVGYAFPDGGTYIMEREKILNYAVCYPKKRWVGYPRRPAALIPKQEFIKLHFVKPI
jgi:hypothetical protein